VYKVDPRVCVFARNLLTKDDWRAALADEVVEGWPKVPLVSKPHSFTCRAERLARTRSGPHGSVVGPSSGTKCKGPDADTGK
jgi:hypothetical protein